MGALIRYSEAFKMEMVRELEAGNYETAGGLARAYGIRGSRTVARWVRQYGRDHLLRKVVRVERPEERDQVRVLEQRVRELEKALADAHLDQRLERAYLELACEAGGIMDVEAFKKKHGGQPSTGSRKARREP